MVNGGDRRTKGWMDEKMDGRTHRRTDVSKFPHVLQDIGPLGPLLKKSNKAGYTAISCGRVGRGGITRFPTFQLERDGLTY